MIRSFLTIALLIAPATAFAQEQGESGLESTIVSDAIYRADVPLPPMKPVRLRRISTERVNVTVAALEPSGTPIFRSLFGPAVPKPFWLTIGNGF